jgi:hypothetical protein
MIAEKNKANSGNNEASLAAENPCASVITRSCMD